MSFAPSPTSGIAVASLVDSRTEWLVCQTRPRCEAKFAALLTREKIHHYLPLAKRVRRYRDELRTVEKPLFPGIVFACVPVAKKTRIHQQDLLVATVAVEDEKHFLRQLAAVKMIMATGCETDVVALPVQSRRVRITGGVLDGVEGEIDRSTNPQGIVVSMDVLHQGLRVRVPLENFQLLT